MQIRTHFIIAILSPHYFQRLMTAPFLCVSESEKITVLVIVTHIIQYCLTRHNKNTTPHRLYELHR